MHSINVTPLTDVLLVLLITFLLTATAFQEGQQEVPLPRLADVQEVAESMTRVVLTREGEAAWPDGRRFRQPTTMDFSQLKSRSDKPILALAVHRDLPYRALYPVMAAARQGGWERIVLLTEATP